MEGTLERTVVFENDNYRAVERCWLFAEGQRRDSTYIVESKGSDALGAVQWYEVFSFGQGVHTEIEARAWEVSIFLASLMKTLAERGAA